MNSVENGRYQNCQRVVVTAIVSKSPFCRFSQKLKSTYKLNGQQLNCLREMRIINNANEVGLSSAVKENHTK